MQITEVENEGLKRAYDVVVAAADLEKQIEADLQEIGRKVKMPGFRPGKIPVGVLRRKYGVSVMGDVLQRTANDAARRIIKEKGIAPALTPEVTIKEGYKEGGDLALAVTLEVMPEVPEIDLSGITLERPVFEVSEEELSRTMEVMAERQRTLREKERTAKVAKGDVVRIDFKGFIGTEAFEGGEAKAYHLEIGSGQFIPGFEEQLIGAKAGEEITVNVPFPEGYHKQDVAGKDARFEVKIHAVSVPELPEIDEAFAQSAGFSSLEALREALTRQLEGDYGVLARNQMKKQLFDRLETLCVFDVPQRMVDAEFDSIWRQHEESTRHGDAPEIPEDEQRAEYRAIADRRVRLGIFLSDVARKRKIEITRDDLTRAVQRQAGLYPGQERKIFEFYRDHPEHMNDLRGPILEEKAVDHIFTLITIQDKVTAIEALLKSEDDGGESGGVAKPAKSASGRAKKKKTDTRE